MGGVEDHAEEEGEQGDGQHVVQARRRNHQGANTLHTVHQLLWIWNAFFSDPDPTFQLVSESAPDPVPDPK